MLGQITTETAGINENTLTIFLRANFNSLTNGVGFDTVISLGDNEDGQFNKDGDLTISRGNTSCPEELRINLFGKTADYNVFKK